MNHEIVPTHRKEYIREDGMLFVRTEGILETMAKLPLIMIGLIVATIVMPIQTSFGTTRTLELVIYSDGSTHVSAQIDVDPLDPDYEENLFGPSIDNFVAVGENGYLLTSKIIDDKATIDTFGSSSITIDYDTHDLISKEGRVWTFSLNSTTDYTLLMPENSVIVGMSALPTNMELIDEQTKLELTSGPSEINYIFGTPTIEPDNSFVGNESSFDYVTPLIIGISIAIVTASIFLILKKKQSKTFPTINSVVVNQTTQEKILDTETIFNLRPEMRDDDKEIIKFISENGGQVFESDLRKKFLQPRTTMWRAVKRLERQGVVEITKKDLQNMVKLKKELEEEE